MSALLRIADSTRTSEHVRDVPLGDIAGVARYKGAAPPKPDRLQQNRSLI
jgi:hypothetical protein